MAKRKHGEEEARARVKKLEAAIAEQTSSCEEEYKEGTSCDECSDRVICKAMKEG